MSEKDYVKEVLRDQGLRIITMPPTSRVWFQPPGWLVEYNFRRLRIGEGFNNKLIDLIATGKRINIGIVSKEFGIEKKALEKQILKLKERGIISQVENEWQLSEKHRTPSRTSI